MTDVPENSRRGGTSPRPAALSPGRLAQTACLLEVSG